MFHKNVLSSVRSASQVLSALPSQLPHQNPEHPGRPILVALGGGAVPSSQQTSSQTSSRIVDLVAITAHRCGSFFAEAAVLVLVLALLDRFIAKGSLGTSWIAGAIALSLALLGASVATDFIARRWLIAH